MTSTHSKQWPVVTRHDPCSVCGKPDRCKVSPDGRGAWCFRDADGRGQGNGAYYRLTDAPAAPDHLPLPAADEAHERADPDTLDAVYTALLDNLELTDDHRDQLRARGFTEEQIDRRGYRILPPGDRSAAVAAIRARFGDATLGRVPGFYRTAGGLDLAGAPGQLLPVRNAAGQVIALQVRPDNPGDGGKYRWLSSSGKPNGTPSGAPVHVAYPAELRDPTIYVTEGTYKADYTADALGAIVIAAPGVSNWRPALPVLAELGAERVVVAYDADLLIKPDVLQNRDRLADALLAAGYTVQITDWNPVDGKGIDDLLAAGGTFGLVDWEPGDPIQTMNARVRQHEAIITGIRRAIAKPDATDGEKLAAIVTAFEVPAELSHRPAEASCRMSRGRIAEGMGKSTQSAGDALKRLENRYGVIRRHRVRYHDTVGGAPNYVWDELRIETPHRTPAAFLEAFAAAEPATVINRGGKRVPKCPDCGDVGTAIRKTVCCVGCGRILSDETTYRDPELPESQVDSHTGDVPKQSQLDSPKDGGDPADLFGAVGQVEEEEIDDAAAIFGSPAFDEESDAEIPLSQVDPHPDDTSDELDIFGPPSAAAEGKRCGCGAPATPGGIRCGPCRELHRANIAALEAHG